MHVELQVKLQVKFARWVKHYTMCKIAHCKKLDSMHFLSYTLWTILHLTQNFYTTSGCDGCDKYEVCIHGATTISDAFIFVARG